MSSRSRSLSLSPSLDPAGAPIRKNTYPPSVPLHQHRHALRLSLRHPEPATVYQMSDQAAEKKTISPTKKKKRQKKEKQWLFLQIRLRYWDLPNGVRSGDSKQAKERCETMSCRRKWLKLEAWASREKCRYSMKNDKVAVRRKESWARERVSEWTTRWSLPACLPSNVPETT